MKSQVEIFLELDKSTKCEKNYLQSGPALPICWFDRYFKMANVLTSQLNELWFMETVFSPLSTISLRRIQGILRELLFNRG